MVCENPIGTQSNTPPFLQSYLNYLSIFRSCRENTVASVCNSLREYLQYIHYRNKIGAEPSMPDAHKDIDISQMEPQEAADVTKAIAYDYLCFLDVAAKNRSSTIRRKLSFLHTFYLYLEENRQELGIVWSGCPFAGIRIPEAASNPRAPKIIPPEEISKILEAVSGDNASRDYALILLIATTGLALQDVILLNVDSYDGQTLITRGESPREVLLTDACIDALDSYLESYRKPLEDCMRDKALFVSSQARQRITQRCAQRAIAKAVKAAGLEQKGYTAQDLRDTAVATVLKATPDETRSEAMSYFGYKHTKSGARFFRNSMSGIIQNSGLGDIGK